MATVVNIKANEYLRPIDRGQSQVYELDAAVTALRAGQLAALTSTGTVKLANGANVIAGTETVIGLFGDNYEEVVGSASYVNSGSGKVTVYHGYGRYVTLSYDTAVTYTAGEKLYCDNTGTLTNVATGGRPPVAVCALAPAIPAAVPTDIPELLKGTQFGARKEDAVRTLETGTKRMFLGLVWLGQI
mgnify:CR=1 FL=1